MDSEVIDKDQILSNIFHQNIQSKFTCLVQDTRHLNKLLEFLITCDENNLLSILQVIDNCCKRVSHNSKILTSITINKSSNSINLYMILIDRYLVSSDKTIHCIIKEILISFINNSFFTKEIIDYVLQSLSKFFYEESKELDKEMLLKYLELLKIFYGENLYNHLHRNYFYFSGSSSIRVNELKLEHEKIKLKNVNILFIKGFVLSLWFKIESFPTEVNANQCDLFQINCSKNTKIHFSLNMDKLVIKNLPQYDFIYKFPKTWTNLTLIVKPGNLFSDTEFILIFPDTERKFKVPKLDCDCEVLELIFFHHFIGQVSTIMVFNKIIHEDILKEFIKEFSMGLPTEKSLLKLYSVQSKNFLESTEFPLKKKYPKPNKHFTEILKNVIENLRICFIPTRYNNKIIFDLTGKYNAYFNSENILNNINNYSLFQKNIYFLGVYIFKKDVKKLMNEELLLKYLELIFIIINFRKKNIKNALDTNFFKMLSIFLEKFDTKAFTKQLIDMLLSIGKSLFSVIEEVDLASSYLEDILLNEKILVQFDINSQIDLWRNLYTFYQRDVKQIKTFLKIDKIIFLLRYYDKARLQEYCCGSHLAFFSKEENGIVMNPDLPSKIDNFSNIVKIMISSNENVEDFKNLIILFSLDISPCLQKILLDILYSYFTDKSKRIDNKKKILFSLINSNFLDILLYVYNLAIIDVRCDLIKLFKEISSQQYSDIVKIKIFIDEKLIPFLKECVIPYNSIINKENSLKENEIEEKDKDSSKNRAFEEDKKENQEVLFKSEKLNIYYEILYFNLVEWMLDKNINNLTNISSFIDDNDNIINPYVIDVLKTLVNYSIYNKKILQNFYQDLHLLLISNKSNLYIIEENCFSLFMNKEFYLWIIETTFRSYVQHVDNEENSETNLFIIDLGKKIHTELIINSILYDEKVRSQPMNNIHYLLSWGIFAKNRYSNSRRNLIVNNYIKKLLDDLLSILRERIKLINNLNFSLWENFAVFTSLSYEYITFYNQEKILRLDSSSLADWGYENIILPRGIFSGLNLVQHVETNLSNSKKELAGGIWSDYEFYLDIYSIYSRFWDKTLFENHDKNIIIRYELLVTNYITNKKSKDVFIDILKLLFHEYKPKDHLVYPVTPVKSIAVMFMITISLLQNEQEIKFWLDEYERFLIFLLLSSSNILSNQPNYNLIQDTVCDIVCFGLCFLIDEYFNTRKKANFLNLYSDLIKHLFIFLSIGYKIINEYIISKKKEYKQKIINAINTLLSGQKDLTKCSLYRVFNDIVVNSENRPLMTSELLNEFIRSNFIDVPEVFNKESWKFSLTENLILKERCKTLIDFLSYEVVIRERYDMMRTYKPFQKVFKRNINSEIDIQNKNLGSVLNSIFNNYGELIKEYQNKVFTNNKVKKLLYKYLKKKLFKFKGAWSLRNLFFEQKENLKLKTLNHYTSYFARPLLTPILDIDYYLPCFTKFQSINLFMKKEADVNYRIRLNIDEILGDNSFSSTFTEKNDFNLIHKIYYNFNVKNSLILQEIDKFSITSSPVYNDKHEKHFTNSFDCCFVKVSHHIKGTMQISKDGIYFRPFVKEFLEIEKQDSDCEESDSKSDNELGDNDPDYDQFRKTCYGSTITLHKKDKDVILYFWPIADIKYIIKKRYYYKKKAFEFFTFTNKSYYFSFKNNSKRNEAIKLIYNSFENKREIIIDLKDSKEDTVIAYENTLSKKIKSEKLSNLIENWANWKISNFEFLSWLNFLSSRSYMDLSQYPVFPWILKNYKENEVSLETDVRDLELPMGMLDIEDKKSKERKKKYLDEYLSETNFEKNHRRHYGSHYSNPIYVSHYLVRLFPFSVISIELQGGGFDDPNRLFFSVGNSFISSATQQGDVRELVPEFFFLPEAFLNLNNLNLGIRNDEFKNNFLVDNVDLPLWSNSPFDFVSKLKDFLESEEVSSKINDWIDLIFGYKQKGEHAASAGNLFDYISYEDNINIDEEENKPYFMRCAEFGLTPSQLSNNKPFPKKFLKENLLKGKQITDCSILKPFLNKNTELTQKNKKENNLVLKLKVLNKDVVISVLNNNSINICRFNDNEFTFNISVENKNIISENDIEKISSRKIFLDNDYYHNFPVCVYSNGKIIAQGGFFDGRISVFYEEKNKYLRLNYFTSFEYPINHLLVDKQEKYAYSGNLFIFQVNNHIWNKIKVIYDHSNEVTSINLNENLNVLASSSTDGYINLYTLPNSRLYRSIRIEERTSIDNVFLSSFPLPVCVIYISSKMIFSTYNINGFHISTETEICKYLMSPLVFTDVNFRDYLIYGNNIGEVMIRRFPSMNVIRKIVVSEGRLIKCIDLSEDKKHIYLNVYNENDVWLIKDPMDVDSISSNNILINSFGF